MLAAMHRLRGFPCQVDHCGNKWYGMHCRSWYIGDQGTACKLGSSLTQLSNSVQIVRVCGAFCLEQAGKQLCRARGMNTF